MAQNRLIEISFKHTLNLDEIAREHPKAISRALNRTAASARTEASAAIREIYNVKKRDVDAAIQIPKEATSSSLMTWVVAGSRRFNIGLFGGRSLKRNRGISVSVRRGQRGTIKAGFLVTGRGGQDLAYRRAGKERRNIKQIMTISISDMFGSKGVEERMHKKVLERFPIELEHQMDAILQGYASESLAKGFKSGGYLGGPTYQERKQTGGL